MCIPCLVLVFCFQMECCISCDCLLLVSGVLASVFLHLVSATGFRAAGLWCWLHSVSFHSFLLAVIVLLLQLLSEIVHNMACLFAATTTGKAVKDEQQQMLQLAAGWAGVVDAASHQTIWSVCRTVMRGAGANLQFTTAGRCSNMNLSTLLVSLHGWTHFVSYVLGF